MEIYWRPVDDMPQHYFVLGTAGHIDHGKTSLVRALTGIDTDRLPEEKHRGITIDIGFAELRLGDSLVGIVDVPGHERFIRNMVAGAAGVDLALLVIAADDSVMPQTREHIAILELLGLKHGLIALTKCDRVERNWCELVVDEVCQLVKGTFLDGAPIIMTSAPPDAAPSGIDELKSALANLCRRIEPRPPDRIFRLPVDRSFTIRGLGTVVTGTVWQGSLRSGEVVEWLPKGNTLDVRGLQNHGKTVEFVSQGQRAAVNLTGAHHRDIERGHELATPGYLRASKILTVELSVLPNGPRPVKHRSRQRMHLGTQEVMCVVALLGETAIRPGCSGLAQLLLASPSICTGGQPFILRDEPATTTLGGGRVLQPCPTRLKRRQTERIAKLELLQSAREADRADAAVYFFRIYSWTELDLCRDANLSTLRATCVLKELIAAGVVVEFESRSRLRVRLHRDVLAELGRRVKALVMELHAEQPLVQAVSRDQLTARLAEFKDRRLADAVVQHLIDSGRLLGDRDTIRHPAFRVELTDAQSRLCEELIEEYRRTGFNPPDPADLAGQHRISPKELQSLLNLCVARRTLVHIGTSLYLNAEVETDLRHRITAALRAGPNLTVSQIRDLLGTSRRFAVPFCEYLDRIGLTRRMGDLRALG